MTLTLAAENIPQSPAQRRLLLLMMDGPIWQKKHEDVRASLWALERKKLALAYLEVLPRFSGRIGVGTRWALTEEGRAVAERLSASPAQPEPGA